MNVEQKRIPDIVVQQIKYWQRTVREDHQALLSPKLAEFMQNTLSQYICPPFEDHCRQLQREALEVPA